MTQRLHDIFSAVCRPANIIWMRDNLAAWRATHDQARLLWDEQRLDAVRAAMQGSATAAAALAWADQHGIEIIVDHRMAANGCYWVGAGVVAIAARQVARDEFFVHAVDALTHEIRHAWQDYHGVFMDGDTAGEAVLEADADAHGKMAGAEYKYQHTCARIVVLQGMQAQRLDRKRAALIKTLQATAQAESRVCHNSAKTLQRYFKAWYSQKAAAYAHAWKRTSGNDSVCFEYLPLDCALPVQRVAVRASEVLDLLGNSFTGVRYLNTVPAPVRRSAKVKQ